MMFSASVKDILLVHSPEKGKLWTQQLLNKKPLFVCTIGYTETVRIPGVSAAGATPELRELTALADAEFLFFDQPRCMNGLPENPLGPPSPVIITKAALQKGEIPFMVVDAGMKLSGDFPSVQVGKEFGRSLTTGKAVAEVERIFEKSYLLGEQLSRMADYLILAESVPGGTTTALAVLLALGIDARGKVSSSMAGNAHQVKEEAVASGFEAAGITFGSLKKQPFQAVEKVGDPMQIAVAAMALAASRRVPVMLAGGTQMAAVLALAHQIHCAGIAAGDLDQLMIGTTRWVAEDPTADLKGIVSQIGDYSVLAANLDFSNSKIGNLRPYEEGLVKEGVGAGAAAIAALLKGTDSSALLEEIEAIYNVPSRL